MGTPNSGAYFAQNYPAIYSTQTPEDTVERLDTAGCDDIRVWLMLNVLTYNVS